MSSFRVFVTLLLLFATTSSSLAFVVVPQATDSTSRSRRIVPKASSLFLSQHDSVSKTPIHLLTGFLGSGKTTVLQHLVTNTENVKIGVIVNDVASINIDAKLMTRATEKKSTSSMIQLQNGCACCSLSDEFVTSIETIMTMSDSSSFDCIVVELSGVADPVAIQNHWKQAIRNQHPATKKADLCNIITLMDISTFGSDYLSYDNVRDRSNNNNTDSSCSSRKAITQLLCEQVEAADVLILNKLDLVKEEEEEIRIAVGMSRALNPEATILTTKYGQVSPMDILLLRTSKTKQQPAACDDPDCTDASHSHSHSHSHNHDPTDTTTSHSHDATCNDPDCNDASHLHSHQQHTTTSTDALGITNFVYKATKPFDSMKIQKLLLNWPIPTKNVLDLDMFQKGDTNTTTSSSPFEGLLRSKGFCWFAPIHWNIHTHILADPWRHDTVMYWSSAGKTLNVQPAGVWWAAHHDNEQTMREFFSSEEYERVKREDFVTLEFGDRRQELVFIGVDLDEGKIREALDDCLLTDEEMEGYRENLKAARKQMAAAAAAVGGDGATS